MAGNSNSGRQSHDSKYIDIRARVIAKGWKLLEENIDNPKLPIRERLDIAKSICKAPTEIKTPPNEPFIIKLIMPAGANADA